MLRFPVPLRDSSVLPLVKYAARLEVYIRVIT